MNAEDIASVTASTVVAVQLIKWGVPRIADGLALAVVGVVSFGFCALWLLAQGTPLGPGVPASFAASWITVMASAAGVYGFVARPMTRAGLDA